ncbi:hypothetical protein [Alysiella filiformis]|uniref:Transmembrane protein n=1 Tax=Alysiella filiformis DSM 16848 TaxID=1120981 RepID=A0A286E1Q9_9NEIS|nr:hypothetical protein [Alysiella filiformis]QMT30778.1 hypothetical protein H3L97_08505 [Alysiella filiformis]UBQ56241.1 hypothetical protein JF568_00180 [Alysiella filiformis DSM 16848]SOD64822.1 hypothetical protein SAMN02746062_00052 [Alysiella filiformis DSM 16848]
MEVFELFVMMTIALTISLVCWGLLSVPLKKTLGFLCDDERDGVKEVAAMFWQRLYLGLTLFLPLLCVLLFVPSFAEDLGQTVLYSLRWAIFGGVSLLLVLAYLVRKQIHALQKEKMTFRQPETKKDRLSEQTERSVTP